MHALGSSILVGFVVAAISACGGDSRTNRQAGGGAGGKAEAGTGALDEGGAGEARGGSGNEPSEEGGDGGTSAGTAAAGEGASGGSSGSSGSSGSGGTPGAGGGGVAGGGAPAGGAAPMAGAGGAGGAGGASLMDPPPNCQSVRQFEDAETCNYEYKCDGRTHFDSCRRDVDGTWACECGTFSTSSRYFEIEGVEGLEACGVIARVCESELTLSPTRTCRTKERIVEGGTCLAHAACGYAVDLRPDLLIRAVEHYRSQCEPAKDTYFWDGGFDCSCEGGAFDRERFLLTAPSIEDVCEPMLGFCTAEEPPVFTGRVCADGESYGTVDQLCPMGQDCRGCVMSQECGKTSDIARDVSILGEFDLMYRHVVCRPEQGELQCTCETYPEGLYSDPSVPSAIVNLCKESRDVCAR
jgi:hypothetical protein